MKHRLDKMDQIVGIVTPHAGVWIETIKSSMAKMLCEVTPHAGVWIETNKVLRFTFNPLSHSPRGSVD